ncbi:ATP-binding protein [Candidatus Roizmanbacteria bacterium]|nr:ATP-binding protein [Candidatus Roizmanbacteria bacterium]
MYIYLPNSAFLGNIDPFLRSFDNTSPDRLEISTNKQWISIHPVVLCMVAALGLACKPENIVCQNIEAKSSHYLKRMKLFDLLGIKTTIEIVEHESAGRFIPLTQIAHSDQLTTFIREMIPLLHLSAEEAEPIRYVVSELTRNVFEHARSSSGAIVCAQYYKKSNTIRIGIVDRGIGIRNSIAESHRVTSDGEAIRLALTPGITGTTNRLGGTEFNAGAGLFFIKSIAKVNKNFFMIYSGTSMFKLLKNAGKTMRLHGDPFKDNYAMQNNFPEWQGTVVGVDVNLDSREEFTDLLKLIRETFVKSVQEKKKAHYKKAQYI